VTLRLADTATRSVREFRPVSRGKATVYLCGPTVQAAPHLGRLRSAVCFDILVRWLEASGLQVTYCRNVTDIDDKILAAAAAEGMPWWQLAERNQRAFASGCALLGCRPADAEPRATGHIPDMVALVERLLASGHAYLAGRDICFDVSTADGYHTLSGPRTDDIPAAEDAGFAAAKRDARDFVLWKAAKPGEPAWRAPWGAGRPGWHIECSAMAAGYLGPVFDIHGGGQDLIFPHHENERAQSLAAGDRFARFWLHHGMVTVTDVKMSKTAGNALAAADALSRVRPQELRYYLGQAHYASPVDYSLDAVQNAAAAYRRIERRYPRAAGSRPGRAPGAGPAARSGPGRPPAVAADLLRRGDGRGPERSRRAGRPARHSPRRQLRSKHGEPGEHGGQPAPGTGHARGPRPRPARARLAGRPCRRPAAGGGGRTRRPRAAAAGRGPGPWRLCFGGLHQGHPGAGRGTGRGHAGRSPVGTGAMNVMKWWST
jgi:cysteinyl-tRNA synthetase